MDDDANKKCGVRRHAALRSASTAWRLPGGHIRPDSLATVHATPHPTDRLAHGQSSLQAVLMKAGVKYARPQNQVLRSPCSD